MSLTFSSILISDVEKLMPIENACHFHPWPASTFASCIGGRYFGEYANIDTNERVAGFYIGDFIAGEATLMDICVAPEFQGKGFGQQLVARFISQAKQLDAESLWLEVRASNNSALAIYSKLGFSEIGRRKGYYPTLTGREDAIVMSRQMDKD